MKSASSSVASIGEKVREVKGVKVLAHRADNLERPQLRTLMDSLRSKIGSGVVVLGSVSDGKVAHRGRDQGPDGPCAGRQDRGARWRRRSVAPAADVLTWPRPEAKIRRHWTRR